MAANVINQISSANTFQQWLIATTSLIGTTNLLTNGNGDSFIANTNLVIGGHPNTAFLTVDTGANIQRLNVITTMAVAGDMTIGGDLTVTGNIILDDIGFDDLFVSGNAFINQSITTSNATVSNVLTANILSGNANTQIYNSIAQADAAALAYAIALG
jgi:hypothetical protein